MALLIVSTLGLLKRELITKNWRGRARQRPESVKKTLLASFFPHWILEPGESGLIGMQTHLLLPSSALLYPVLSLALSLTHTEDYAYCTGRVC